MEMNQASFDFARNSRDVAIEVVANNAGQEWCESAYSALTQFAKLNKNFMTEDVRLYTERKGIKPHDNRAWGAVTVRAIKAGIIKRAGYAPSKTGHMRPMPMWESAIFSTDESAK